MAASGPSGWRQWIQSRWPSRRWRAYRAARWARKEIARLEALPRYTPTVTHLLGSPVAIVDAASFLWTYQDIFVRELYRFRAAHPRPYIVDAGANIGLSVLYFKHAYPDSEIVAFEPDPIVFATLERNVRAQGYGDVRLIQRAVWPSETTVSFWQEGADGGRIAASADPTTARVQTVRLRDYLDRPVDFLKLDIEGAETAVLSDCGDTLRNVAHLYVEYHSFAEERQTLPALLETLDGAGFRVHLQPCSIARQPFWERPVTAGFDLQIHVFGFRS